MNVTTTQQPPQTSVLGSMGKAGAIGAAVGAGTTGAIGGLANIAMKHRPSFKDSFTRKIIDMANKYPNDKHIAEVLQNVKNGKLTMKTILKSAASNAIPLAIIFAGVAGVVGLIKSVGKKS